MYFFIVFLLCAQTNQCAFVKDMAEIQRYEPRSKILNDLILLCKQKQCPQGSCIPEIKYD
jgi:hypothetical protein